MSDDFDSAGNSKKEYVVTIEGKQVEVAKVENTATTKQKIFCAVALIIFTAVVFHVWRHLFGQVEARYHQEYKVSWEAPRQALKSGSPVFWHDKTENSLHYRGVVDKKEKQELLGLLQPKGPDANSTVLTYTAAIDELAYKSQQSLSGLLPILLLLSGFSGCLGTQLRSILDFVGNACFKERLDLVTWWPWYVLRPFSGFLLGSLTVVFIQAGLYKPGENVPMGPVWWVGIAFLAGFGADDFTLLLRQLTKTIFGQGGSRR